MLFPAPTILSSTMPSANLYSNDFLATEKNNYILTPTHDLWEDWIQQSEGWPRMFVKLTTPFGTSKVVSVGDPVYLESIEFTKSLFLPLWMLDSLGVPGDGFSCSYELVSPNSLEKATKIVVRPVENLIHGVDVKQELEYAFSQLGVLSKDETILVNLHELGGESTFIHIQYLEPADTVFLDGDTIPIEFETSVYDASGSSLPSLPSLARPPTPIPTSPPMFPFADLQQSSMIPDITSSSNSTSSGFVPFSGKGHSLK